MPSLDQYHDAVRNALIKDGWTITHDPLTLQVGEDVVFIDLGAERLIAAEKGTRKIAVEVKTFAGQSRIFDLEVAIGQYVLYQLALKRLEPERELFLAVPRHIVENEFQHRELWRAFIADNVGKVVGYDAEKEVVTKWLP